MAMLHTTKAILLATFVTLFIVGRNAVPIPPADFIRCKMGYAECELGMKHKIEFRTNSVPNIMTDLSHLRISERMEMGSVSDMNITDLEVQGILQVEPMEESVLPGSPESSKTSTDSYNYV